MSLVPGCGRHRWNRASWYICWPETRREREYTAKTCGLYGEEDDEPTNDAPSVKDSKGERGKIGFSYMRTKKARGERRVFGWITSNDAEETRAVSSSSRLKSALLPESRSLDSTRVLFVLCQAAPALWHIHMCMCIPHTRILIRFVRIQILKFFQQTHDNRTHTLPLVISEFLFYSSRVYS